MSHPFDDEVFGQLEQISDQTAAEAERAAEAASNDVDLMSLAEEYAILNAEINDLESNLKRLKERKERLRKVEIPDKMRALGMVVNNKGSFSFSLGKIHLETRTYCSIDKEHEVTLHEWLRSNNAGALIKPTVNGSALSALVRELREEGQADPPAVSVYEETAIKFVGRK